MKNNTNLKFLFTLLLLTFSLPYSRAASTNQLSPLEDNNEEEIPLATKSPTLRSDNEQPKDMLSDTLTGNDNNKEEQDHNLSDSPSDNESEQPDNQSDNDNDNDNDIIQTQGLTPPSNHPDRSQNQQSNDDSDDSIKQQKKGASIAIQFNQKNESPLSNNWQRISNEEEESKEQCYNKGTQQYYNKNVTRNEVNNNGEIDNNNNSQQNNLNTDDENEYVINNQAGDDTSRIVPLIDRPLSEREQKVLKITGATAVVIALGAFISSLFKKKEDLGSKLGAKSVRSTPTHISSLV